jgi:hypothetical protein
MNALDSKVNAAKTIATRLIKRNAVVTRATKQRDVCLYKFFEAIVELDELLRKMGKPDKARKRLNTRYGVNLRASKDGAKLAIKLTHPTLDPRACSKYVTALRFVHRKKRPGQSVRDFMQAHGDIKGCVEEEKTSRPPKSASRKRQKSRGLVR